MATAVETPSFQQRYSAWFLTTADDRKKSFKLHLCHFSVNNSIAVNIQEMNMCDGLYITLHAYLGDVLPCSHKVQLCLNLV